LALEASTNAFFGRLKTSRDFLRQLIESAERSDEKETAAMYEAYGALWEAMFGNATFSSDARYTPISAPPDTNRQRKRYTRRLGMMAVNRYLASFKCPADSPAATPPGGCAHSLPTADVPEVSAG